MKMITIERGDIKYSDSKRFVLPSLNDVYEWDLKLSQTCWNQNHDFISRVCGIKMGLKEKNNSISVGWMPSSEKNSFTIYGCVYVWGENVWYPLGNVKDNEDFTIIIAKIDVMKSEWDIVMTSEGNQSRRTIHFRDENFKHPSVWNFELNSHFGKESAPNLQFIYKERIN